MRVGKMFPSKFLKAADLDGPTGLTIKHVHIERMQVTADEKPVVYFEELPAGLVLNKSNATTIAEICGSDEALDWQKKKIVLYPTVCDLKGKTVPCIRVQPVRSETPDDDDLPF